MKTLFPYPFRVVSVRVDPKWVLHAEKHANKIKEDKGKLTVSTWAVAQRVSEIAFATILGDKEANFPIGKWAPSLAYKDSNIKVHGAPVKEKYNFGSKAKLIVRKTTIRFDDYHILALYDPPYVDFVGYATKHDLLEEGIGDKSLSINASELRETMDLLKELGVIKKK